MINWVSFSKNGDSLPAAVVKDPRVLYPRHADRLEAIGKIGIQRCLQYTQGKGTPLFTYATQRPKDEHDLWNNIATQQLYDQHHSTTPTMIDHYYHKLLRLGFFTNDNTYFTSLQNKRNSQMTQLILRFGREGHLDFLTPQYIQNLT